MQTTTIIQNDTTMIFRTSLSHLVMKDCCVFLGRCLHSFFEQFVCKITTQGIHQIEPSNTLNIFIHSVHSSNSATLMSTKTISKSNLDVTTGLASDCKKALKTDAIVVPPSSSLLTSGRSISAPSSIIKSSSSIKESLQKRSAKLGMELPTQNRSAPQRELKTTRKSNLDVSMGLALQCGQPLRTDAMAVSLASSSLISRRSISSPSSIIECLTSRREIAPKRSAKLGMDSSTQCMGPQREQTVISCIRSRKRSHLRSISEPIWSHQHSQHSVQSSLDTETKTIAPKRRKLSSSSYIRVIGRQSSSKSETSMNETINSHFPSLSLQDPPLLTLSCLGNECTTPTRDTSSDELSENEDIDIAVQSGKQSNMEREERSLNGLDPFKFSGASDFDIDLFNNRVDFFQL